MKETLENPRSNKLRARLAKRLVPAAIPLILLTAFNILFRQTDDYRRSLNIDPDYAFFVSAIDISRLNESRLIIHPGTPCQILGHYVMKTDYLARNPENETFAESATRNPPHYLNLLAGTFRTVNLLVLLAVGAWALRVSQSFLPALMLQITPLLAPPLLLLGFRRFTPDILLTTAVLLFLPPLFILSRTPRPPDGENRRHLIFALLLGLLCGFGTAVKFPFIVLALIPPLILPGPRSRLAFFGSSAAGFLLSTFPIIPSYPRFLAFLKNTATHDGYYGSGAETLLNPGKYLQSLLKSITANLPFYLILGASLALILFLLLSPKRRRVMNQNAFRVMAAIAAAQLAGALLTAKHYQGKYLIPVLGLSGLQLLLIRENLSHVGPRNIFRRRFAAFAGVWLALSLLLTVSAAARQAEKNHALLRESGEIESLIRQKYPNYEVIYYYGAPSPLFGLEFGRRWSPTARLPLRRIHGTPCFYNHHSGDFYLFGSPRPVPLAQLATQKQGKLLLLGQSFSRFHSNARPPAFPTEPVYRGKFLHLSLIPPEPPEKRTPGERTK